MSSKGTMQNDTTHREPNPGIAAYALGVLDPEEQAELEAHLGSCLACRVELERYQRLVGELGAAVSPVAPRPELRGELLSEIRADHGDRRTPSLLRRQVPAIWLGIAAAIAVMSIVILGAMLNRTQDDLDHARYTERAIADYLKDGGTLSQLVPAPGAPEEIVPGHGTLIVAPDQSGAMLVVYDLPPTSEGRTYHAWAERAGERVDLGELVVSEQGVGWLYLYGPEPMSTYDTIGMTLFSPDAPDGVPFLVAPVE